MAHSKKIAQHPFKPMDINSPIEKDGNLTKPKDNETGFTEVYDLSPIKSQNNIILTPPAQSPPQTAFPEHHEHFANLQKEHFANLRKEKEADTTTAFENQQIQHPHEHDVLMGRGNFVNYHPGNQYFRSLVKKHFLQYISTCKTDKPKYAELIIDEVGMRIPPGRFLAQDSATEMWFCISHKKAIDKTRQALREGAPEAKSWTKFGTGQEEFLQSTLGQVNRGVLSNLHDQIYRKSSEKSLMTPNHVGSSDASTIETTNMLTKKPNIQPQPSINDSPRPSSQSSPLVNSMPVTNAPVHRRQSVNNLPINTGPTNSAAGNKIVASEKLANSVAARLMQSNGIKNANIENLVALGILAALNGGVNGTSSMQKNVHATVTGDQYRMSDEPSITSRTNTANMVVATDESLVNVVASGVAQLSELSSIAAKVPKRGVLKQMSDISLMSNKRWKRTTLSIPPPSLANDSVGAEALLAMSHRDDEIRKDSSSEGGYSNGSDKNVVASPPPELIPLPLPKNKQHPSGNSNGIYSTPALGNFMQCDTCLGAGILPIPASTISTLRPSPKDLLPNPASSIRACTNSDKILQNINCESSVLGQFKNHSAFLSNHASSIGGSTSANKININRESSVTNQFRNSSASGLLSTAQQIDEECGSRFKEGAKSSIWTDRIRRVEKKWNIALDENKNFSQRVEAIESKALFCRKVLNDANISSEEKEESQTLPTINTDGTLKDVELAEDKWGLSPPEGYNLTERIESIEQTAYRSIKRLELWF